MPNVPSQDLIDHYGFKPSGSTVAALIVVIETVSIPLETNKYVRCLIMAYPKAFDRIDHAILLRKLVGYYLRQNVIYCIVSFLSERIQFTKVGTNMTGTKSIKLQLLEGRFWVYVFLSILIIDITPTCTTNHMVIYADEVSLPVPQNHSAILKDEFENIKQWARRNTLTQNL